MLLLALAMVLRCVLDPWNTVYYAAPAVLALLAWEAHEGRLPVVALLVTAGHELLVRQELATPAPWVAFVVYVGLAAVLVGWMARRLYAPATTRRALDRPVSTSAPSSVTTARSSMRTPTASGT